MKEGDNVKLRRLSELSIEDAIDLDAGAELDFLVAELLGVKQGAISHRITHPDGDVEDVDGLFQPSIDRESAMNVMAMMSKLGHWRIGTERAHVPTRGIVPDLLIVQCATAHDGPNIAAFSFAVRESQLLVAICRCAVVLGILNRDDAEKILPATGTYLVGVDLAAPGSSSRTGLYEATQARQLGASDQERGCHAPHDRGPSDGAEAQPDAS